MPNIRDEQRALRDQQRAAIKAAVANANAIIEPVAFRARYARTGLPRHGDAPPSPFDQTAADEESAD